MTAILLAGATVTGGAYAFGQGAFGKASDWLGTDQAHAEDEPSLPKTTTTVKKQTLVSTQTTSGTLGYGEPRTLNASGSGVLTGIAAEGSTVRRGESPYRIDNQPVPLLHGDLPLYRTLQEGIDDGPDVEQLEKNLKALGYGDDLAVDEEFTDYTAETVEAWQQDLGLEETGRIGPGQVVVTPGPIRIDSQQAAVGDQTGGGQPVLDYTGTDQLVTVDLEVEDRQLVDDGDEVTVELPDGNSVDGTVESISNAAQDGSGQGEESSGEDSDPTIEVTVELETSSEKEQGEANKDKPNGSTDTDSSAVAFDQAPVSVELTGEERQGVLAVPIMALLALREGGYGVEVVHGKSTEIVPVELGMFTDGLVEVSGPDLREGMEVGVPES